MKNHGHWAWLPCLTGLAMAALGSAAMAQVTSAQQNAIKSSCRSDFMSKCSSVKPGGPEALACLQKNVASLSAGCKTAVTATLPPPAPAAAAKPAQAAPRPAAAAAPPPAAPPPPPAAAKPPTAAVVSAPPPKARIAAPPRAAAAAPAPKPVATAAAPAGAPTAAQQNAMKQSCRNDFMAKCKGVAPGGKEALGCLQTNVTTLSASCKKVVAATMPAAPAAAATAPAATPVAVTPAAPAPNARLVAPASPLIVKACARDIVMHCRGIQPGSGRIAGCLNARIASGAFVGPRCRTALKISSALD